jgi:hypothetical protein
MSGLHAKSGPNFQTDDSVSSDCAAIVTEMGH